MVRELRRRPPSDLFLIGLGYLLLSATHSSLGIVRKCKTSAYEFLSLWENLWERAFAVGRN